MKAVVNHASVTLGSETSRASPPAAFGVSKYAAKGTGRRPGNSRERPVSPAARTSRAEEGRAIKRFEEALWAIRYIILVPVVAVALAATGVTITTTLDALRMGRQIVASLGPDGAGGGNRILPFGSVLQVVEGYLLAAILIIFALGLYELFIARIGVAKSDDAPRTLVIRSVDDLKERLGRVVLLALVIEFFQQSLRLDYAHPVDLLYMATGIVLVGGALYLSALRPGD